MAGGKKLKNVAGKIQGWVSSGKGDANASLSDKLGIGRSFSNKFDQRLQDGLDDLLGGALGIKMSKVPDISAEVLSTKETARKARQIAVGKARSGTGVPGTQKTLQFPLNYFADAPTHKGNKAGVTTLNFPNSIHFRTLRRKQQDHSESANAGGALIKGSDGETKRGFMQSERGTAWRDEDVGAHGSINANSGEIDYDIFLHLPEKLTDEVKVEYAEAKAGMMEQFFSKMLGGGEEVTGNDKTGFDANEVMTAFKGMMPGGEIIQKAAGHMTNPMVFQTLKNVNFRSYSYSFKLMPTSPQEAEMIKKIVFAFKLSMLPGTAGENNLIWTLPNEWAIAFEGPIREWIDFPLVAVCTGATVDYSQYLMAGDGPDLKGEGAPSSITLTLSFIETAQLSRQKFASEVGAGGTMRKSRAEEGTKLGALSRLSDEERNAALEAGASTEGGGHGQGPTA